MNLPEFIADLATAISQIDTRHPQAANARTGVLYQPGIGPHPETQAVQLMTAELPKVRSGYEGLLTLNVPYPGSSRQKCDLCVGRPSIWEWAVEIKLLRLMGDNGKANDNMLMHILSPYAQDRSALTDCAKLVGSGLALRYAIVIYGFDYPERPMDQAIEAFEALAARTVVVGPRVTAAYGGLVHPIHQMGRVFGWEVRAGTAEA